jgi:hypothetical protein
MKNISVAFAQLAAWVLIPSTISDLLYYYQYTHSSSITAFVGGTGFVIGLYFIVKGWNKK